MDAVPLSHVSWDKDTGTAFDTSNATKVPQWFVITLVCLAAFALRLYWFEAHFPVISIDGAEYLTMASHLRQTHQLTSSYGNPETMYAPLFAIAMAALSFLGLSINAAAHVITLLSGTVLVLLLFTLSRHIYGPHAALRTGALAAIHPLLIPLSASIYSESLYLTLWILGIYVGILALQSFRLKYFIFTGLSFGFAYLTRPEAFAYPIFFAFAAWIVAFSRKSGYRRALLSAVIILGTYALVAAPYVSYFHRHTGHYQLEGKWNIDYTIGNRIHEGMSDTKAAYEVGTDLTVRGPLLDPFRFATYTPYPESLRNKLRYIFRSAKSNWPGMYLLFADPAYGSPLLLLFVFVGLFSAPWGPDRLLAEFVLLTMALSIIVLLCSAHHLESRYSYPFVPLAIVWSGNGLIALERWFATTFGTFFSRWRRAAAYMPRGFTLLLLLLLLVAAYPERDSDFSFRTESPSSLAVKQAGDWLQKNSAPSSVIAAMNSRVSYYGRGIFVQFPYADPQTTLKYLISKKVEYVVLESDYANSLPTVTLWLAKGIDNKWVRSAYDTGDVNGERVRVFQIAYKEYVASVR